jgi:hypothetical protein
LNGGILLQRKGKKRLSPGGSNENQILGFWDILEYPGFWQVVIFVSC